MFDEKDRKYVFSFENSSRVFFCFLFFVFLKYWHQDLTRFMVEFQVCVVIRIMAETNQGLSK